MTLPFENDTSAIVKKLADRSIRADKRRNMFIVVTIALAACLMMSIALYSFGNTHEMTIWMRNRYQAAIGRFDMSLLPELKKDEAIEKIGVTASVTNLLSGKNTINVTYQDRVNLELMSVELTDGRWPEQENEVTAPASYLKKLGKEAVVGTTITLNLGERVPKEYIVCGITKDAANNTGNAYEVLVSQAFLDAYYADTKPYYSANLRMTNSSDFENAELKQHIIKHFAAYGIEESRIAFSSSYFGTLDNTSRDISVVLGVSLLIAVACATVIYSLFYVSVTGKIKEYGRLRVIGMTQKQVRLMVQKESWKLSLLSIPAGLALGSLIGFAIVPGGWYWPNTIKCAVVIALVTELAVQVSIRKPVKIASSVSPIEAVRVATTTTETAIEKTRKLSRRMTPAALAKINFARNHKKVTLTLASLGFTGIFLMCASTILTSADPVDIARQNFVGGYEMKISLNSESNDPTVSISEAFDQVQHNNPLNDKLTSQLLDNPYIKSVTVLQSCTPSVYFPGNSNVEGWPNIEVAGLSKEFMKQHQDVLLDGGMDYDELAAKNGILIDDSGGMVTKFGKYTAAVGDIIEIETESGEKVKFTVMGMVDLNLKEYAGFYLYVPQELLSAIRPATSNFNSQYLLNIDMEHLSETEDYVYELCGDNQSLGIQGMENAISFSKETLKSYQKPIYALVIFIGLFALINLINTLMTNLISRQQEFGVMQSIGLSGKQLAKMLQVESAYYVAGTIIITLTLGTVAAYAACRMFSQVGLLGTLKYTFPVLHIAVFFAALCVIAAVYSILAIRYCRKQSLVDRIKTME